MASTNAQSLDSAKGSANGNAPQISNGGENSGSKAPGGVSWDENPPEYKTPENPWGSANRDESLDENRPPEKLWGAATRDEDLNENRPPTGDSRRSAMGMTDNGSGSEVGQKSPAGALYPGGEKELQNKLRRLQKNAPKLAKNVAEGGPAGIALMGIKLASQFDASKDWLFILLFNFAILKDLIDIILELTIPPVGIVVKFITAFLMLLLTIVVMVLTGTSLKNRGAAKYITTLAIATIADALPFPIPAATIEVFVIYGLTLFDRLMDSMEEEKAGAASDSEQLPTFAAADNYYEEEERMAA